MSAQPTLINLPPPPSDPVTPSDVPSRSGTPNSTTTSMSELSTVAIKDGYRGHLPHYHNDQAPTSMDAERADRISRLAGLERVATARNPTPLHGNLTPGAAAPPQQPQSYSYFDHTGNPAIGRERSTVGSASATGSVGARTTWAGSEAGDDKMSESQDMEMDTSSMGGMSEEGTASLVGFGEGARTPARQSTVSSPGIAKAQGLDAKMIHGVVFDRGAIDPTSDVRRPGTGSGSGSGAGAEEAERIVRDNMNTTSADRMRGHGASELGKFVPEK